MLLRKISSLFPRASWRRTVSGRVAQSDDSGLALIAVIGLMLIAALVSSLILVSVVSSYTVATASRANVQAQAAAQAGVAAAAAGVQNTGNCTNVSGIYTSTSNPIYRATVYIPNGSGWLQACPIYSTTQVRIISTGTAATSALNSQSASNTAYVEAVYNLTGAATGNADGSIFNTGTNGSGGVAADNTADLNWQVAGPYAPTTASKQIGSATPLAPYTTSTQAWGSANVRNQYAGAWLASPYNNANWIGQRTATLNYDGVLGDWYYRYQFTLPDATTASKFGLYISFYADNAVSEVWVNGVAQSTKTNGLPQNAPYPAAQYTGDPANQDSIINNYQPYNPYWYYGYKDPYAATTTLNNDYVAGVNTVIVLIKSGPTGEGFLGQMRANSLGLCSANYSATPVVAGTNAHVSIICASLQLVYNRNVTSATP